MTLQHELTTLPQNAVTILRYMNTTPNRSAEYEDIMYGTGLSERATGKAIKRLVTRFFMRMDETRMYHMTPKGNQAIELLASHTDWVGAVEEPDTMVYDLCAVVPSQIGEDRPTKWMLGISPASAETAEHPTELLVRLSAEQGTLTPTEAVLRISSQKLEAHEEFMLVAPGMQQHVRVRVEVYQLLDMDEPRNAGGMYFDLPLGNGNNTPRAIHTPISLF